MQHGCLPPASSGLGQVCDFDPTACVFLSILLQGLGVSDDEAQSYRDFKRDYGDLSGGSRPSGSSSGPSSSGGGGGSSGSRAGSSSSGSSSAGGTGAGSSYSSGASTSDYFSRGSSSSSSGSGGAGVGSGGTPPLQRQSTQEYVENELAALKRKLGKQ